jgi:uncharacterized protein YegP (UPF0339 family)
VLEVIGLPAKARFEIYKDQAEKFRWKLRAPNNREIASGQGYESKEGCMEGVESVKKNAPIAKIEPLNPQPEPPIRKPRPKKETRM